MIWWLGLTCGQWGCKQLKGGWNSKPSTAPWSDTSGLNSSPPLAAGPRRLWQRRKESRKKVGERGEIWKETKTVMMIYWTITQQLNSNLTENVVYMTILVLSKPFRTQVSDTVFSDLPHKTKTHLDPLTEFETHLSHFNASSWNDIVKKIIWRMWGLFLDCSRFTLLLAIFPKHTEHSRWKNAFSFSQRQPFVSSSCGCVVELPNPPWMHQKTCRLFKLMCARIVLLLGWRYSFWAAWSP